MLPLPLTVIVTPWRDVPLMITVASASHSEQIFALDERAYISESVAKIGRCRAAALGAS